STVAHVTSGGADVSQVNDVIGRAAGRKQPNRGVDDRLLVDDTPQRAVVVTVPADLGQPVDGCARQFLAKLGAGIDEGGARDMQSHHLHHHLVRVGGAVEGTGAL